MMRRFWMIAALALPIAGLAGSAAWHEWQLSGAKEWRIPVTGYDPRDLLAGHYAQYRFAWQVEGKGELCRDGDCVLCLEGRGGTVIASARPKADQCANRVDPDASAIRIAWHASTGMIASGRVFVPERDAARITGLLTNGNAILVARLSRQGRLMAERIEPAAVDSRNQGRFRSE